MSRFAFTCSYQPVDAKLANRVTYQLSWPGVQLTIKSKPPEIGIYIIQTDEAAALPENWFGMMKDALTQNSWKDIDWSFDQFPGPGAGHCVSTVQGHNAQVWLERDALEEITWFRFSYAL